VKRHILTAIVFLLTFFTGLISTSVEINWNVFPSQEELDRQEERQGKNCLIRPALPERPSMLSVNSEGSKSYS